MQENRPEFSEHALRKALSDGSLPGPNLLKHSGIPPIPPERNPHLAAELKVRV